MKTLNDLLRLNNESSFVELAVVKAEAINDIKAIQSIEKSEHDKIWEKWTGNKLTYAEEIKQGIINYIKWKNNITSEDLK